MVGHLEAGLLQSVPAPPSVFSNGLLLGMNQCVPFAAFVSMWSGRLEELDSAEEYPLEKNNQGYLLSSLLHFPVIKQLCQHRTTG